MGLAVSHGRITVNPVGPPGPVKLLSRLAQLLRGPRRLVPSSKILSTLPRWAKPAGGKGKPVAYGKVSQQELWREQTVTDLHCLGFTSTSPPAYYDMGETATTVCIAVWPGNLDFKKTTNGPELSCLKQYDETKVLLWNMKNMEHTRLHHLLSVVEMITFDPSF